MMKRNGEIAAWQDRRIRAGDPLDSAIDERLERSDIILLLLSPAFLASDYCYDIEKSRALELQNEGKARVISVILRPCDWRETPLAHFLVTPTDGKAVVKWSNQDEAFQDIVKSIRNALPKPPSTATTNPLSSPTLPLPARSSNLRIKKSFTQADQDEFAEQTFHYRLDPKSGKKVPYHLARDLDKLNSCCPDFDVIKETTYWGIVLDCLETALDNPLGTYKKPEEPICSHDEALGHEMFLFIVQLDDFTRPIYTKFCLKEQTDGTWYISIDCHT